MTTALGPWVVDASAVIPLVADESSSARADLWFAALVDLPSCVTLDLCDAECTNALWKRRRWARWSLEEAEAALESVLSLPFQRVPFRELAAEALRLAAELGLTAYDACYVALATTTGLPLATADRRMARAARAAGCTVLCLTEDD